MRAAVTLTLTHFKGQFSKVKSNFGPVRYWWLALYTAEMLLCVRLCASDMHPRKGWRANERNKVLRSLRKFRMFVWFLRELICGWVRLTMLDRNLGRRQWTGADWSFRSSAEFTFSHVTHVLLSQGNYHEKPGADRYGCFIFPLRLIQSRSEGYSARPEGGRSGSSQPGSYGNGAIIS